MPSRVRDRKASCSKKSPREKRTLLACQRCRSMKKKVRLTLNEPVHIQLYRYLSQHFSANLRLILVVHVARPVEKLASTSVWAKIVFRMADNLFRMIRKPLPYIFSNQPHRSLAGSLHTLPRRRTAFCPLAMTQTTLRFTPHSHWSLRPTPNHMAHPLSTLVLITIQQSFHRLLGLVMALILTCLN